jgi:hypothetical protein
VAVQTSWDPRECGTYHHLLDREERRLDEAYGGMMPDELPGAVVAVAEVWLDDAYDNITLVQACLGRQHEEKRAVTLEEHPEPPDGETSAEKARRLWIPRALQQTSYVSHMAREVCDDSAKADWGIWTYREYRRLLDDEMMAVCRIYAEVKLADLPVREGKEAQGWLTSAHQDAERAQEHIGEHIRRREGLRALLYPDIEDSSPRTHQRRARGRAFLEARGAGTKPRKQAEGAAARARLQATRATRTPGRSQLAEEADTETEETRSGQQRDPTCPRTLSGAKADLVDSTSESDTSDPGGRPQLFRGPAGLDVCPPKPPHTLPRQQDEEKVRSEEAVRAGGRRATSSRRQEGESGTQTDAGGRGRLQLEGDGRWRRESASSGPATGGKRRVCPRVGQLNEHHREPGHQGFGTISEQPGWLYSNGESEDYCAFRAKCRLFQETYHKATPPVALVKMFREWNLAEDVACRIEGAKDMPAAWRTLDSIYGTPLALTLDQTPEAGGMPEPQEVESGVGSDAGPTSEEEPAPLQAKGATAYRIVDVGAARPAVETATSPQGKHVFINTPHGIRSLRRLWVRGEEPEHTVVSKEVAQRYSMRADGRRQATWIMGPTGVTVGIDTDYEMFLLVDDLPGRTKRITVYAVDSVEKYCGLPTGATDEYEIQLRRDHVELLEQLREDQPYRTGARLSERWGETIWRLAAYAESGEHVWINIIRSYQQEESEITLATSRRLGYSGPGERCLVAVEGWDVADYRRTDPRLDCGGHREARVRRQPRWKRPKSGGVGHGHADWIMGLGRVKEHLRSRWRSTEVRAPRKG